MLPRALRTKPHQQFMAVLTFRRPHMSVYTTGIYTHRHGTVLFLPLWSWVLPVGETRSMPWDSVPLFPPPHDSFGGRWELGWKQDTGGSRYCHRFESFLQLSRAQEQKFSTILPLCLLYQSGISPSVTSMTEPFKRKILHSLISSVHSLSCSNLRLEIFCIINPLLARSWSLHVIKIWT